MVSPGWFARNTLFEPLAGAGEAVKCPVELGFECFFEDRTELKSRLHADLHQVPSEKDWARCLLLKLKVLGGTRENLYPRVGIGCGAGWATLAVGFHDAAELLDGGRFQPAGQASDAGRTRAVICPGKVVEVLFDEGTDGCNDGGWRTDPDEEIFGQRTSLRVVPRADPPRPTS